MTFDPTITSSELATSTVALIGMVGGYFTLKANFMNGSKRQDETERKVSLLEVELAAHKLRSSETFVRRDDIDKLEERLGRMFSSLVDSIGRRMESVESQLRNIDNKIASVVSGKNKDRE